MLNRILIDKISLINNVKLIREKNKKSLLCAMVKANAYGVGAKEVVKILNNFVDFFGVSNVLEAKAIMNITNKKILIVGAIDGKIDTRFSYTCFGIEDVERLAKLKIPLNIHLKVNVGMNRFGFKNILEFKRAILIINNSMLNLEGVFTHFPTADKLVDTQFKKFKKFVNICHMFGLNPIIHADNSSVSDNKNHHLDMVRIGFNLFNKNDSGFKPIVKIESKIIQINEVGSGELVGYNYRAVANKPMRVAVLPIGYADGFDMHYLGINLFINGFKCKVLNICMDCFMLDVTNTNLKQNDKVEILNEQNNLLHYASFAKTHEYEVMTKFSYLRGKRIVN